MTKTFTDDDGNKFKFVDDIKLGNHPMAFVIEPIEPAKAEKNPYQLVLRFLKTNKEYDDLVLNSFILNKPQAYAIADAIKAVIDHITSERGKLIGTKIEDARKLMKEDK